jgi:alpha-L-fucosidase
MIRQHQPEILINNRLPQPRRGGDWGYPTPEQRIGELSSQPWESCITSTRKFWGYHRCHDDPSLWYTERELITMFVTCVSRGGNLLLNVGPYGNGELPALFKERTRRMGEWIRANAEAVYGTEPVSFEFAYGGVMARKQNRLYLFFLFWPGAEYSVPGYNEKLVSARLLASGRTVKTMQEPHRIVLQDLPEAAPDVCTVVELTFAAPPTPHPWAAHRLHNFPMPGLENWARL